MTQTLKERRIALGVPRITVARAIGELTPTTVKYVEDREGDPYVRVSEAKIRAVIETWEKDGPPDLDLSEQKLAASEVANIEALAKAAKRSRAAVPAAQLVERRAEREAEENARWSARVAARNARKAEITEELRAIRDTIGMRRETMAQRIHVPEGTLSGAEQLTNTLSVSTMEKILAAYRLEAEAHGEAKATPKAAAAAK